MSVEISNLKTTDIVTRFRKEFHGMSNPKFPGRQSLLKVNRYSLMMRPSASTSGSSAVIRRSAPATLSDPSLPLRGRPSKRVKMEYMSAAIRHQHSTSTFIMKLFDRSVDLARFSEGTGLYPVCRAWMQNAPRAARKDEEETRTESRELQPDIVDRYKRKEVEQIEKMPKAVDSELKPFELEKRFPKREEQEGEETGVDEKLGRDELIKEHKERWSGIRRRWVNHRKSYLANYQQSFDLLDAIMMKQA